MQGPVRGELDWVVGCTYQGQPQTLAQVRNVMGCNMAFRASVFAEVGGFTEGIGRVGTLPLGCEETELCIRLRHVNRNARILFEPAALVHHQVSADRLTWSYLRRRSYAEGVSKAAVAKLVGADDALSTERAYTSRIIPLALLRELASGGVLGAFALVLSVLSAAFGYLRGSRAEIFRRNEPVTGPAPIAIGEFDLADPDGRCAASTGRRAGRGASARGCWCGAARPCWARSISRCEEGSVPRNELRDRDRWSAGRATRHCPRSTRRW